MIDGQRQLIYRVAETFGLPPQTVETWRVDYLSEAAGYLNWKAKQQERGAKTSAPKGRRGMGGRK